MKKISSESKSFIVLIALAFLGALLCLMLWTDLLITKTSTQKESRQNLQNSENYLVKPADSSSWPTYTNKELGLSFKYNPAWKILPQEKKDGFTVLQIDPGTKFYNIKIYVSPKSFYIMDGLPAVSETIGGEPALNVNSALYGIRANNLYYTFDIGFSMSLLPNFVALVESAKFN